MPSSVVVIKDHVATTVTTLMFSQEQKDVLLNRWTNLDPVLVNLQYQPTFQGRLRLTDLDPYHFRVLLALNLRLLEDLDDAQKLDAANITMRGLDWSLLGLINCIETRSQSGVTMLMINRISAENVLLDVSMSMEPIKMPKPRQPGGGKLRVLVDNDRG